MAAFQQQYGTIWNRLFAVAVITALIPIALLLPLQRHSVRGWAEQVKGVHRSMAELS